jgi:hypothetical protein
MDIPGVIGGALWLCGTAGTAFGAGWKWREKTCKAEVAAKDATISHQAEQVRWLQQRIREFEAAAPVALKRENLELERMVEQMTKEKQADKERLAVALRAAEATGDLLGEPFEKALADARKGGILEGLLEGTATLLRIKVPPVPWSDVDGAIDSAMKHLGEQFAVAQRGGIPDFSNSEAVFRRLTGGSE